MVMVRIFLSLVIYHQSLKKEFVRLFRLSFSEQDHTDVGPNNAYIDPMNATDDRERDEWVAGIGDGEIEVVTWKQFVEKVIQNYLYGDDFDE